MSVVAPIVQEAEVPPGLSDDDPTIVVYPRATITGLNAISMVDQVFEAELQMELVWRDPSIFRRLDAGESFTQIQKDCWHPGLTMDNVAELKNEREVWFRPISSTHGIVSMNVRLHACFRERFELKRFPFDWQWLVARFSSCWTTVRFSCDWPSEWPQELKPSADYLDLRGFILEEWKCFGGVCMQSRPTMPEASASGCIYPQLNVRLMIKRQYGYYLWNIALIDLMLVLTSLTVLLVPAKDFADRMALSLTLLLTAVAFKQVVSSYLPAISYLTTLDKYILCGFLMQVLVVLQNTLAKIEVDALSDDAEVAWSFSDFWGGILLTCYMVAYHAYFLYQASNDGFRGRDAVFEESVGKWLDEGKRLGQEAVAVGGDPSSRIELWHRVHESDREARRRKRRAMLPPDASLDDLLSAEESVRADTSEQVLNEQIDEPPPNDPQDTSLLRRLHESTRARDYALLQESERPMIKEGAPAPAPASATMFRAKLEA